MHGHESHQADTSSATIGHLLPEGSIFGFLRDHRREVFAEDDFADLFPSGLGRGSLPGSQMAAVMLLQALYAYSDRDAADAVIFDLRWKTACGFPLDYAGFHPSTLTYWRRRIASSTRPNRIFDAVAEVITATGILSNKRLRAVDSTVFDDAVARQDTITQLISQIRKVGRTVDGAAILIPTVCHRYPAVTGQDYTPTGKPPIDWDDETAQQELVSALVGDALVLFGALDVEAITTTGGPQADAVALLGLVAGQDVEPAEGSNGTDGRWRIARKVAPDRVISTVDPESRHAHKTRAHRQDGFKAHIVVEPDTGLATAVDMTTAAGIDGADHSVGARLVTGDQTLEVSRQAGPVAILGDTAYGAGVMLRVLQDHQLMPVIKPWPLPSAVPGGFTVDDFRHDDNAGTVTCPVGHTRVITPSGKVNFKAVCRDCELRARCTTAVKGKVLVVSAHDLLLRRQRWFATLDWFQQTYRRYRPMVERSLAWITRGARRLRYRGVTKNNAWLHTRVAGVNLRRLITLGLTRTDGAWAITA
ncbi:IS1182 family transposase [Corynebacterium faecale]|uniref:IS1182 family transposase n=1 Tax=Corynebacterium faecale TaxID=1758466 RepID=UPI0025B4D1F9|nr:IS1182 family transposase [Corynebacterium faecale]